MSSPARQGPYVALDFETSAYSGPCACAIGMARIENNEVTDKFYALVRPPSSRVCFTRIHGLKWADLKDQPTFAELWEEIAAFMAGASHLVAHNAVFDRKVLRECCMANDIPVPDAPFLCTCRGARYGLGSRSNSLDALAARFGISLDHHHAGSDALACALLYIRLRELGVADTRMRLASGA